MRVTVALTGAVFLVVAGGGSDAKKEMARLEGEWSMVSGEIEGKALPPELVKDGKRVAKDGEVTITIGGQVFLKAQFTIDPSKKPRTIDYTMTGGFTKGQKQRGIYDLDGDTVKFCFGSPGKERPTEFTARPGSGWTLSVWKRDKN